MHTWVQPLKDIYHGFQLCFVRKLKIFFVNIPDGGNQHLLLKARYKISLI